MSENMSCDQEMDYWLRLLFLTYQAIGRIGGHYIHTWCPYVRPSEKQKRATTLTSRPSKQNTRYNGYQECK